MVKFSAFNAEVASTLGLEAGEALKSKFEFVSTIGVLAVKLFFPMKSSIDWVYPPSFPFFEFFEFVLLYSPNWDDDSVAVAFKTSKEELNWLSVRISFLLIFPNVSPELLLLSAEISFVVFWYPPEWTEFPFFVVGYSPNVDDRCWFKETSLFLNVSMLLKYMKIIKIKIILYWNNKENRRSISIS